MVKCFECDLIFNTMEKMKNHYSIIHEKNSNKNKKEVAANNKEDKYKRETDKVDKNENEKKIENDKNKKNEKAKREEKNKTKN